MIEKINSIIKHYMYKIAGLNHMIVLEKDSGDIIGAYSKFKVKKNELALAGFSRTLCQLTAAQKEDLDVNITEFSSGEKIFTISGGENVIISALSDKSVQIGMSRMLLKKLARRLDQTIPKLKSEIHKKDTDKDLAEIFQILSAGKD
ncbi:MAG: hypothetical protein ACTSXP_04920 [Promethearchaeota archaeon]